ncbi:MAG: hypothetical protein ABIJ28_00070 [Patescibacteria group bacterium]
MVKTKKEEIKEVLRKYNLSQFDKDQLIRRLYEAMVANEKLENFIGQIKVVLKYREDEQKPLKQIKISEKVAEEVQDSMDARAFRLIKQLFDRFNKKQ